MLTGVDHVVIAVRDLAEASKRFRDAMGLTVTPGGQHPGLGTANAIVRFGLDYIELLSIHNQAEAMANPRGRTVAEFLEQGEGLLGFGLASDSLGADRVAIEERGIPMDAVRAGSRVREDGRALAWETASVTGDPWGGSLPFLIQHQVPASDRLTWAPKDGHPLTARRIGGVSIAVNDLLESAGRYEKLLGLGPELVEEVPALPARRATFRVGDFRLDLLMPLARSGGLFEFAASRRERLFMVTLQVPDIDRAVAVIAGRGTAAGRPTARKRAPLLDHAQTLGARFQLVEQVW